MSDTSPALDDARAAWRARLSAHVSSISGGDYQYFELLREHVVGGIPGNRPKIIPFVVLPILLRARNIVELGSSFTYFPETYPDASPWRASTSDSEGLISTRAFLVACRFLNQASVPATLTSVDIRESSLLENAKDLFTKLDLIQYWRPAMGVDSIEWLKSRTEKIDLALVDGHHTYAQVRGELEGLAPLMSHHAVIIVDDCYDVDYQTGVSWAVDETPEGTAKGGEYGAIVEFLDEHPEWTAQWVPGSIASVVYLRGGLLARQG